MQPSWIGIYDSVLFVFNRVTPESKYFGLFQLIFWGTNKLLQLKLNGIINDKYIRYFGHSIVNGSTS